jgi:transposase
MIGLNRRTRVYLCKQPTDMRASYDTLFVRVKSVLNQDPFSGHLFVFVNGRRTTCKCLYYDGTGLCLLGKRMEKGTFSQMNPLFPGEVELTTAEFGLFFEGANLQKRFIDSPLGINKSTRLPKEVLQTNPS